MGDENVGTAHDGDAMVIAAHKLMKVAGGLAGSAVRIGIIAGSVHAHDAAQDQAETLETLSRALPSWAEELAVASQVIREGLG